MSLGKFIKINGITMPNPIEYNEEFENIETINTSEAGTDLVVSKRLMKLTATMTFQLSQMMYDYIKTFCELLSCDFNMDGKRYVGRLRLISSKLEPESYNTDGFWTVVITFSEK